jgi:hypothetical protein
MFLPKDLLFSGVKAKVKQFLAKYTGIDAGLYHKQYQEAYDRYTEITSDASFKAKILELTYLEMIIAQVHCMHHMDPRYTIAQTTPKKTFVYARVPYPRHEKSVHMISRCIGTIDEFGDNHRKISDNFAASVESHMRLLSEMKSEFIYPLYKEKFKEDV